MPSKELPVVDRGSFFDDSFFKDSWEDFDSAMQRVLDRFDSKGLRVQNQSRPQCQDLYRQIRQSKIGDDMYASQAVQVTEKDGRFQAVMDVRDFNPRDLQVKVVDERIIVEGRFDQVSEDGKSSTSKAFYKEFNLPPQADIDQVSTALSKDGVLTIRAPKKEGYHSPKVLIENLNNASQTIQNAINERMFTDPNFCTNEGYDSLPRELKERLKFSDRDSGRSTASGSPIPTGASNTPCFSPTPSDIGSDTSRISNQKSEVSFQVRAPDMSGPIPPNMTPSAFTPVGPYSQPAPNAFSPPPTGPFSPTPSAPFSPPPSGVYSPTPSGTFSPPPSTGAFSPPPFSPTPSGTFSPPPQTPQTAQSGYMAQQQPFNASRAQVQNQGPVSKVNKPGGTPAVGSGGTATISVREEDGKRTMTQETSSVVQEKDGFLESKEVASEITGKDTQAARREATTRMMRQEDDPSGRFSKSEAADASDVSESSVQQLADGSVVTVKKSSTSSSNFKKSFSSAPGPQQMGLPDPSFGMGFGDFPNMTGRNPLMSQMSSDSVASNASRMSNFSDMSNFSRFSNDMPGFPNMPNFNGRPQFSDMSHFPRFGDMPGRSGFQNPNFPNMQPSQLGNTQNYSSTYSTSSSTQQQSFQNAFDNRKF